MLSQALAENGWRKALQAMQNKDLEAFSKDWAPDIVAEFPAGMPYGGVWRGKELLRGFFQAVFDWNVTMETTLEHVAVYAPASILGTMRLYGEWSASETSVLGQHLDTRVLTVSEMRAGKVVFMRNFYADVPAMMEHYAGIRVPSRIPARI